MAGNTGGFKLPVASSSYHEKCISASLKAYQASMTAPTSDKTYSMMDYRNCNQVAQNRIWSETVLKEYSAAKRWKMNWGFMAEYDFKGRKRENKDIPKELFQPKSTDKRIPQTSSKQYGLTINSPSSQKMYQLQKLTSFHKKKSGLEENYT